MGFGRNPHIARVPGEAFDADQISDWRCRECGRGEYGCACPEQDEEKEQDDA